jgi:hypothetical protein
VAGLAATVAIAIGAALLYAFGGPIMGRLAGVAPRPPRVTGTGRKTVAVTVAPAPVPAPVKKDTVPAPPPPPVEHRVLVSTVEVSPPGASIRRLSGERRSWLDRAELSVTAGDSVQLAIDHPRYESRRVWFKGRPIRIVLGGGTGTVLLTSAVTALVELRATDGSESILARGQTPLTARLAPGTYRATFRARSFDDSSRTVEIREGAQVVVNVAYTATGSLLVEVTGGAATVRIDGAEARPAPAEFLALSPGRHVVSVERGQVVTRDTVVIFPGRRVTRRMVAP